MKNIICFSTADWDNPYWTNKQHVMSRLGVDHRVLYIESLGLRQPTLEKRDIRRIGRRLLKAFRGPRNVQANVFVVSPIVLPFHKYPLIRALNEVLLLGMLKHWMRRLDMKSPILWTYVGLAHTFIGKLGEQTTVYHCVDDLSAIKGVHTETAQLMEANLLRKVDVVFATSSTLYAKCKEANLNTHYLPNVADADHFAMAMAEDTVVPEDICSIPSPRIGFIGAISEYKIDLDLIEDASRAHPDKSFVLIGGVGEGDPLTNVSRLQKRPNVHMIGGRPYSDLPAYLKGLDVCLIPNKVNKYTEGVFPMKTYEYLAAGKPVVATALPTLENLSGMIHLTNTSGEFCVAISNALLENSVEESQRRHKFASNNTWSVRISQMLEIIASRE